jgi:hypothetical protein
VPFQDFLYHLSKKHSWLLTLSGQSLCQEKDSGYIPLGTRGRWLVMFRISHSTQDFLKMEYNVDSLWCAIAVRVRYNRISSPRAQLEVEATSDTVLSLIFLWL